jgi:hypothetical protein
MNDAVSALLRAPRARGAFKTLSYYGGRKAGSALKASKRILTELFYAWL